MSFFAIIFDPHSTSPQAKLEVLDFHCGIAQMNCIFGSGFYCDVGLRLRAVEGEVSRIKVLLPFELDDHREVCWDLRKRLRDYATLIFARNLNRGSLVERPALEFDTLDFFPLLSNDEKVRIATDNNGAIPTSHIVPLGEILGPAVEAEGKKNPNLTQIPEGGSLYELDFRPTIRKDSDSKNSEVYLRMRFRLTSLGRTSAYRTSLLGKNGVVFDFRFYDEREAAAAASITPHSPKIVSAQRVNIFLLFPWSYQLIGTSPAIQYMRLLEGEVWKGYFGRIGRYFGCLGAEKLVIYQWRSYGKENTSAPVSAERPFRVFADFSPEAGSMTGHGVVVTALLSAIITVSLLPLVQSYSTWYPSVESFFVEHYLKVIGGIGVTSILAMFKNVIGNAINAWKTWRNFRAWWHHKEDSMLGR